jgi:3-hydroxyacyl-[acyl-carrier-protein] dehydratase
MMYNKNDILNILPHREPFLFLDSCSEVMLSTKKINSFKDIIKSSCTAHYKTKKDHPIFRGHFPEKPILPGVIHSEIMAQSSVFIIDQISKYVETDQIDSNNLIGVLVSIDSLKLKKPIYPEDNLDITTSIDKVVHNIIVIRSTISKNNVVCSKGILKIAIINKEKLDD